MYARRILREKQWNHVAKRNKCFSSSNCRDYSVKQCLTSAPRASSLNERRVLNSSLLFGEVSERCCTRLHWRSDIGWSNCILRFYSSEGDGRNASEDKQVVVDCGKEKIHKENSFDNANHRDAHACLGEHDQIEWLKNEKLAIESRKKDSPFITRRERIKNEISRRIVPWEKITVSWDTFPYYLQYVLFQISYCCACILVSWWDWVIIFAVKTQNTFLWNVRPPIWNTRSSLQIMVADWLLQVEEFCCRAFQVTFKFSLLVI